MLERTMKSFGAAVVFLAVNNLLTVSSNSSTVADPNVSDPQVVSTAITTTLLISTLPTGTGKYESNPTTGSKLSAITENVSSAGSPRSANISDVISHAASTVEMPKVNTTESSNKDVNDTTDKMSTVSPKEESTVPSIAAETTSQSIQVSSREASTEPSHETQTNPAIDNKVQGSQTDDSNNSSSDSKKQSGTSNKGIKIGAGCVAAFIAVIVLVVIYKICRKKPPAAENAEVKTSAETKENVKLLSVKTENPNSDVKRTSSNQMECIEC